MSPFLRKLLGMNWLLVASVLVLCVIGVVAIYAGSYWHTDEYWRKQITWVAAGLVVFFIVSFIPYGWTKWAGLPMFVVSVGLVGLTYTHFGQEHGGAKCWLLIPGVGTFQPSQMALIAAILTVGLFLSQFRRLGPMTKLIITGAIVAGPMVLILKQPDFGMTLVFVPVILVMLFIGLIPKRHMISILIIGTALLPLVLNFGLKDYQRARIIAFTDPDIDPTKTSYAITQALKAIGSAGYFGKGFKAPNSQVEQGFVPVTTVHTDYIFTVIAEKFGFFGSIILISIYAVLLLACLFTAHQSADQFGLIIVAGFAMQIYFHVYQNIGMCIGLMPITGLPLPFVSYGGTFIVLLLFAMGLVNSVWIHRRQVLD